MYEEDQYPDVLIRDGDLPSQGIPCRFIPNNSRGIVKVVDGVEVEAKYVVAMPEETPVLLVGELVTGIDERGDHIIFNEPVLLFHHGRFHCKVYV